MSQKSSLPQAASSVSQVLKRDSHTPIDHRRAGSVENARTPPARAIDLALAGDLGALRICLDRILPPRKDRPVAFEIPPITTIEDAPKVMAAVTAAVAQGGLTVREASDVAQLVEAYVRSVEASDLEKRLREIEENLK